MILQRLSPEHRIGLFYFTQFLSGGAAVAYAGSWFAARGFSAEQIGLLNALPIMVLLLINLFVGRLADRARDWRQAIIAGSVASAIFPAGLFLTGGYGGILLVWTLTVVAQAAVSPVVDAATMRVALRRGSDFGSLRAWGTVGYMIALLVTGYLVVWGGAGVFLPLFVGLSLLRGLAAFALPNFRAETEAAPQAVRARRLLQVMRPWFLLPLLGWSMVYATLLILNVFQGLQLEQQGVPANRIGILIALAALSETVVFFGFKRFAARYSARHLMLISATVAVLRWLVMATGPDVGVLVALQLTHGIIFTAGFMGCMAFIANWTSEDIAAEAQSFFVILQQATAILAILGFGWLTARHGATAYLGSAVFAALGGVLVLISLRIRQPHP